MSASSVTVLVGGEAGQGLVTVGDFLAKALVRAGYEILVVQDYLSRIRGGHNTYCVRVSPDPVHAPPENVDLLVALDQASLALHGPLLSPGGLALAGEKTDLGGLPGLNVPYSRLCPRPVHENMAALGVLAGLLCLERSWLEGLITERFAAKGGDEAALNLKVFSDALDWTRESGASFACLPPPMRREKRLFLNGNEAIALGAMAAGVNFCSFYPMTPATSVAAALVAPGGRMGVLTEQAEDEIAAVNMALGASAAGARVLVPTSGGGFALMVEGVSLAGMIETPLTVVLAQRPGPATGLPTRTEQGDLNLVVHAGHGDFPRAVYAPGTPEQCFDLTFRAVNQAEKWQSPAFVLTDQYLADSYRAVAPFDLEALPPLDLPGLETPDPHGYERYALTENGVSPRLIPGFGEHLVVLDSDEHTPDGHITEDLGVRVRMVDKRLRKGRGLEADAVAPSLAGDAAPEVLLACWGSSLGACLEAAQTLRERGTSAAVLHFSQVWPLVPESFLPVLEGAGRAVMVEGNPSGQLAKLIRQETGFAFHGLVTRYDGLPFTAGYILARLGSPQGTSTVAGEEVSA
ncbi:2-oxoglutarate oxidoreductase subunit KorA [Fundidesulfovibrio magnetotacticus]|uniref:2-oxoglutarate oxidoreductase subunit KorA n=1 Tax=Fundidesulfovibrio magnetotacticus TaxID=2730080 RepID=A0A6V8LYD6_9BACT|nr:2-oxoacid:acceptor oxidoreductase subunit alpha [Fundidesulfovibrio magnetotacticus]GFK95830.1 2-oxoglutarate oxidoreductase subunit KorA [Fundidesulfovibrio magnetotacticus]